MKRLLITTGIGLVGTALVVGCSHSGKSSANDSGAVAVGAKSPPVGARADSSAGGSGAQGSVGGGNSAIGAKNVTVTPTSLIVTADMSVQVRDVSAQADKARNIALDAGGKVDGDDRSGGTDPFATLTLRVLPSKVGSVLDKLHGIGRELSREMSTKDVTTEVTDVNSRVDSATKSIAKFEDLFDKAVRVSDMIEIEQEIAARQADLESLQAQQRVLDAETSLATVTLHLTTTAPKAIAKDHRGFLGGLSRGWDNFTGAVEVILTGLGVAAPFVLTVLLVGAAGVLVRQRRRRATPVPVPASDPS